MHDPLVVAFEIRRPWPKRTTLGAANGRWRFRGAFWTVAGRNLYWPDLVTIWHREPNGRDSGEVCKHYTRYQDADGKWQYRFHGRWKLHVHHWKIQIHPLQHLHRWLFERCTECGRRYPYGYAPVSHQWGEPRGRWWHVTRRAYHHECSSLVNTRRTLAYTADIVRLLAAEIRVRANETEAEMVERLTGYTNYGWEHHLRYRLQTILGYERDDDYELVKTDRTKEAGHG